MDDRQIKRDLRGPAWCMLGHMLCMGLLPLIVLSVALTIRCWPEIQALLADTVLVDRTRILQITMDAAQGDWYETFVSLLNVGCAILSLIPFAIYGARRQVKMSLAPREATAKRVLALIVMAMCVNGLTSIANVPVEWLFNRAGYSILRDFPLGSTPTSQAVMTVYAAVLAPVIEEILFRGYLLGGLRRYGDRFAVISSAALFALMHGNLSQFLSALCIGLLLGYTRVQYGSLLLCILAHAGNNLLALGMSYLSDGAAMLLLLALIALGIPLLRRWLRQGGELSDPASLRAAHPVRRLWLNAPMLVYLLYSLWQIVSAVMVLG